MVLVKCETQITFYDMQTQFFLNIKEASLTFVQCSFHVMLCFVVCFVCFHLVVATLAGSRNRKSVLNRSHTAAEVECGWL